MKRKLVVALPATAFLLLVSLAFARRPESAPAKVGRADASSTKKAEPKIARSESRNSTGVAPTPLPPPPKPSAPAEQGKAMNRAVLRNQLGVYVSAAARGDETTRKAVYNALLEDPRSSRELAADRLTQSQSVREIEILNALLGQLQ